MACDATSFTDLIAPMTLDDFVAGHWQRRHLVQGWSSVRPWIPLFSFADVDRYLAVAARNPSARMATGKAPQPPKDIHVRDAAPRSLYEAFCDGSTLMFSAIDQSWAPAAELAASIGSALSAQVKINVYMTPAGHQGAPIHPDVQDVFVLQMEGEKDWFLYEEILFEPVETLDHVELLPTVKPRIPAEPVLAEQLVMRPGDLLYIPRGQLHRAVAPATSASLHLTICVTPFAWIDLLKAALESAAGRSEALCRSLPPGFERDKATLEGMAEPFRVLLQGVCDQASLTDAADLLRRAQQARRPLPADGHFAQLVALEAVHLDVLVERREGLEGRVEGTAESPFLRFGKTRVAVPAVLAPAFEYACAHRRFLVRQLPDSLADDDKVAVARRLIRYGFVRQASAERA